MKNIKILVTGNPEDERAIKSLYNNLVNSDGIEGMTVRNGITGQHGCSYINIRDYYINKSRTFKGEDGHWYEVNDGEELGNITYKLFIPSCKRFNKDEFKIVDYDCDDIITVSYINKLMKDKDYKEYISSLNEYEAYHPIFKEKLFIHK